MRFPRPTRTALARASLAGMLALALGALPARAAWHAREEIPVESAVYRMASDLASSYRVTTGLLSIRPWTRAELGRFLAQLVADRPEANRDPAVLRLLRELEPGGRLQGLEPMLAFEERETSLEISSWASVEYGDEQARDITIRDVRAGLQFSAAFGERGVIFADGYLGTVTPGPHGTPDGNGSYLANETKVTPWFDRAYAVWQSPGFMARAGHTFLSWGPGLDGTLALSDGAPAFDVLEAGVRLIGESRLQWFVAALDPAGETYLAGHRLALRPGPGLEMGVSEMARFDGSGNVPLYLVPVVPFALLDRRARGASELPADSLDRLASNNILVSADLSWTWRPGVRLYGELLLDDVPTDGSRPLGIGWQLGAHVRRLVRGRAWTLRGDYTRVCSYVYSVSHHHDFQHAGFPTGFPLGPDVERLAARLEWRPDAAWAWGLEGVAVRKGVKRVGDAWEQGDPVPGRFALTEPIEEDRRVWLTADWSPSPSFSISAVAGFANVGSLGHVDGVDADGAFGRASAAFRW